MERMTTKGPLADRAWEQMRGIGKGVMVKESNIVGAGKGLFAGKDFKIGEFITLYDGPILSIATAQKCRQAGLATHIRTLDSQYSAIDGFRSVDEAKARTRHSEGPGGGSFANHGDLHRANSVFVKLTSFRHQPYGPNYNTFIVLRAKRGIRKGEEILANYGSGYWRSRTSPTVQGEKFKQAI